MLKFVVHRWQANIRNGLVTRVPRCEVYRYDFSR